MSNAIKLQLIKGVAEKVGGRNGGVLRYVLNDKIEALRLSYSPRSVSYA
jgi:hypothetical protein